MSEYVGLRCIAVVRAVICSGILLLVAGSRSSADEVPAEYRTTITKGLEWLAKQQWEEGRWTADAKQYPEAMTGLSGVALLMEGSTLREGKYAARLRRAVDWLISRSQPNGLIGVPEAHYMYGHGYAMLFLACVFGEESDVELRRKLEDVLTRAVLFSGRAQDRHGGWHYLSANESGNGGDSSSTVTQMQGLRAARNAGIVVPKEIIDKGLEYLRQTTSSEGGVRYGWGSDGKGSLALTAASLASSFSAGEYDSDLVRKWIRFCRRNIPLGGEGRLGHDEYTHCYLAQSMFNLGEDRYVKLFPDAAPEQRLTWSKYRKATYDSLMRNQSAEGGWNTIAPVGAVYATAMHLIILQLDNAVLPIFQR